MGVRQQVEESVSMLRATHPAMGGLLMLCFGGPFLAASSTLAFVTTLFNPFVIAFWVIFGPFISLAVNILALYRFVCPRTSGHAASAAPPPRPSSRHADLQSSTVIEDKPPGSCNWALDFKPSQMPQLGQHLLEPQVYMAPQVARHPGMDVLPVLPENERFGLYDQDAEDDSDDPSVQLIVGKRHVLSIGIAEIGEKWMAMQRTNSKLSRTMSLPTRRTLPTDKSMGTIRDDFQGQPANQPWPSAKEEEQWMRLVEECAEGAAQTNQTVQNKSVAQGGEMASVVDVLAAKLATKLKEAHVLAAWIGGCLSEELRNDPPEARDEVYEDMEKETQLIFNIAHRLARKEATFAEIRRTTGIPQMKQSAGWAKEESALKDLYVRELDNTDQLIQFLRQQADEFMPDESDEEPFSEDMMYSEVADDIVFEELQEKSPQGLTIKEQALLQSLQAKRAHREIRKRMTKDLVMTRFRSEALKPGSRDMAEENTGSSGLKSVEEVDGKGEDLTGGNIGRTLTGAPAPKPGGGIQGSKFSEDLGNAVKSPSPAELSTRKITEKVRARLGALLSSESTDDADDDIPAYVLESRVRADQADRVAAQENAEAVVESKKIVGGSEQDDAEHTAMSSVSLVTQQEANNDTTQSPTQTPLPTSPKPANGHASPPIQTPNSMSPELTNGHVSPPTGTPNSKSPELANGHASLPVKGEDDADEEDEEPGAAIVTDECPPTPASSRGGSQKNKNRWKKRGDNPKKGESKK